MKSLNCTRRDALKSVAALAGCSMFGKSFFAGLSAAASPGYKPILSVQIYIWIQQFQAQKKTFGEGIEEALPAVRRAGFQRVELTADFLGPDLRDKTLALLESNQLEMPTFYAGSALHEPASAEKSVAEIIGLAEALEDAGVRAIVTNPNPKPNHARKTDEELAVQARYLNRLGAELQKLGMRLMVHHHTPELVENAREWRYQLQHTDPELVFCCVDTHWALRGGQEPLSFLREAGTRLASVHLRNSKNGIWMEVFGDGDIDYRRFADYLRQINFDQYLVVELAYEKDTKVTRSLEENLRLSRLYAEKVIGL